MTNLPLGIWILKKCGLQLGPKSGKTFIFLFTLFIYACFHASRKPISIVKPALHANCSEVAKRHNQTIVPANATFCWWKPFDKPNYDKLLGFLDLANVLSYAISMFFSGHLAERINLRIYLSTGCIASAITTIAFGFGYFLNIHVFYYYLFVQILSGMFQATGWPAVVTCMGNWFGKSRRGFFLGLWNSHTSLGNILGAMLAGRFVDDAWGWSFVVPGLLVGVCGFLVLLFLVPYPEDVGLPPPYMESLNKIFKFDTLVNESEESATIYACIRDDASYGTLSNGSLASGASVSGASVSGTGDGDDGRGDGGLGETRLRAVTAEQNVVGHGDNVAPSRRDAAAISVKDALLVPGVLEYSTCLFFAKLVSYTFLFWLPAYIRDVSPNLDAAGSADLSTLFDWGGIAGGVLAGLITDRTTAAATTCASMLITAVPVLGIYYAFGSVSLYSAIGWLLMLGVFVNGPYALITTAVSADLGTHPTLQGSARALATVTAIIDGTGSLGAALGPLLCGLIKGYGWLYVFLMLMGSLLIAALLLARRVVKEVQEACCAENGGCCFPVAVVQCPASPWQTATPTPSLQTNRTSASVI